MTLQKKNLVITKKEPFFDKNYSELRSFVEKNFNTVVRRNLIIEVGSERRVINYRSWGMFYIDQPIKYSGQFYDGFCIPLFGATCIVRLLKDENNSLSRRTLVRTLKHLFIGKMDSAVFELDFLNLVKRYHYDFSDEAIESFLLKFNELVSENPIRGKKYLPAFQLDPERLTLNYKDSTILTNLALETEKELASRQEKMDYSDTCDYDSVYVEYLGINRQGLHNYYLGHSKSSVLARRSDKGKNPRELLLAFTKRLNSPAWEESEGLELRLQALISWVRFIIEETKFKDVKAVRNCGKNGFFTKLTPAEIITICLGQPECYADYEVVPVPKLRNLNKFYKKFSE